MVQVFILGLMARCTKVSGLRALRMAKAFGKVSMATRTSENGDSLKLRAMVFISGKMAIGTKVSGKIVSNMDKAPISSPTGTATQAFMLRENLMGKANTSGKMAVFTSESSRMVSNMAKANGKSDSTTKSATCMKDSTKTIRRMGWACSPGKAEIIIRDVIKMMKDTDTVK